MPRSYTIHEAKKVKEGDHGWRLTCLGGREGMKPPVFCFLTREEAQACADRYMSGATSIEISNGLMWDTSFYDAELCPANLVELRT